MKILHSFLIQKLKISFNVGVCCIHLHTYIPCTITCSIVIPFRVSLSHYRVAVPSLNGRHDSKIIGRFYMGPETFVFYRKLHLIDKNIYLISEIR